MADVVGWRGVSQPKCSVCRRSATRCCSSCSRFDGIFAVCDPKTRDCLERHGADPEKKEWRKRVAFGPTGKRTRPAGRENDAENQGRGNKTPTGSRSGAHAYWDSVSRGPARGAPRNRGAEDSEDED